MDRKPAPIPAWMFLGSSLAHFHEPDVTRTHGGHSTPKPLAGLFGRLGGKR